VELTKRIQIAVRSYDLIGRYGGEEFLILLPDCTAEEIDSCAERVRATVAERPFEAGGVKLPVTVSLGTAVLDPLIDTHQETLVAADQALYRAKHSGRNRAISAATNLPMNSATLGQCTKSTTEVSLT
jgi:two-component system cell cycle response regulator